MATGARVPRPPFPSPPPVATSSVFGSDSFFWFSLSGFFRVWGLGWRMVLWGGGLGLVGVFELEKRVVLGGLGVMGRRIEQPLYPG